MLAWCPTGAGSELLGARSCLHFNSVSHLATPTGHRPSNNVERITNSACHLSEFIMITSLIIVIGLARVAVTF